VYGSGTAHLEVWNFLLQQIQFEAEVQEDIDHDLS
jgi:hypothetical protein